MTSARLITNPTDHPVQHVGSQTVPLGASRFMASWIAPLVLAVFLFGLNNLAVLGGLVNPPEGYVPTYMIRDADIAQYLTWLRAFQSHLLIPDYQAPWLTEPAFFNPLLWVMARASTVVGGDLIVTYHIVHFLLYVATAYALFYALRTFSETPKQACAAFLVVLCSIPLASLAILPAFIFTLGQRGVLWGIGDFVWWSSDGFFHGISGSLLVTFGTGITIASFAFLARYLTTEKKRYLGCACLCTFLSALIHPFEVVVIVGAGAVALFFRSNRRWSRAVSEVALLGLSATIGIAPYVLGALQHAWLQDVARINQWSPGSPLIILSMLGLPTILAIVFLVLKPKMASKTDLLLQCWFAWTLIAIYLPWVSWSQHLLDGFHYAAGLLLVRQASQSALLDRVRAHIPRLTVAAFAVWCLVSLAPYSAFYWQSLQEGNDIEPARLFSTVAPSDEQAAIAWFQQHAQPDQLVLAPLDMAPWFATVPMHSFASHYLFSLTFAEQASLTTAFYLGNLEPDAARQILKTYGVRYIVVPERSPAVRYIGADARSTSIGALTVYELDNNSMKPYSRSRP